MKSTNSKSKISRILFASIFAGLVLQACNASLAKSKPNVVTHKMDKKTAQALFNGGVDVYLKKIIPGGKMSVVINHKFVDKPVIISQGSFLREIVVQGQRGKKVKDCQFIAARIELDGKADTVDWLITTKGKGVCGTRVRNYWIAQQIPSYPSKIWLEGLALHINIFRHGSNSVWSDISIRTGSRIKNIELNCNYKYTLKNGHYEKRYEQIEAYKPTGSMLNAHTPEMFWEDVTGDSSYQCRS